MVKAVIDTNIWLSAVLFPGQLSIILNLWQEKKFKPVFSTNTFSELRKKLIEFSGDINTFKKIENFLIKLENDSIFCSPTEKLSICRDPDDNKFLEIAFSLPLDYLVSGDKDILDIQNFTKTQIIPPRRFIELMN